MHEDIEPYKPDWEYFGFAKAGPPPLPDSDATTIPYETPPATPEELEGNTRQEPPFPRPLLRLPSRVLRVMKRLEHMKTMDPTHQSPKSKECDTQVFDTPGDIDSAARLQPEAESEDMDMDSYSCHDIDSDNPDPNDHWYDSSHEEAPPEQEPYNCYTSDEESNICITCPGNQRHTSHQLGPMTIHPSPPATHSQDAIDEPIASRLRSKTKTNSAKGARTSYYCGSGHPYQRRG
jgi:hypothetical protein